MEPIWQTHSSPAAHAIQDGPGQARLSPWRRSQHKEREKCVCYIQQQLFSRVTGTGLFSCFLFFWPYFGWTLFFSRRAINSQYRRALVQPFSRLFFFCVSTIQGDLKAKPVSRKPQHGLARPPHCDTVSWVTLRQAAPLQQRWITCWEGV